MQYKSITLELLEQRPALHEQLRKDRLLLATMERLAVWMKDRHDHWTERLGTARPGSDPSQLRSEAMEIAIQELVDLLPSESAPSEDEPLSLEAAMRFISHPTPPA